jgi:Fe-S-cluster containining protein
MTYEKGHEEAINRSRRFQMEQPRELVNEALALPGKVAKMNAKPMIRINPILDLAGKFSKAVQPYTACQDGCSHCCHIEVAITGIEALQLGSKIGVKPAKLSPAKLRPKGSFSYETPCTFLVNNRCSIYEHRPFACRNHSSFEPTDEPCKLTNSDGTKKVSGQLVTPDFPGLKEALNVVVNLVGKTEYADIRDYFPNGNRQ